MATSIREHEARFVESLHKLVKAEERGALAALRRGLGKNPGHAPEMHRWVVPFLPRNSDPANDDRFYVLASLFAYWHQAASESEGPGPWNLGESLAQLRAQQSSNESLDTRFEALLNSHVDDLPTHLRHMIALLRGKGIAVSWAQLLADLRQWDHPERFVQRRWARAFWASLPDDATGEPSQKETDEVPSVT